MALVCDKNHVIPMAFMMAICSTVNKLLITTLTTKAVPRRTKKELEGFTRPLRLHRRSLYLNIPQTVSNMLGLKKGDQLIWYVSLNKKTKLGRPRFRTGPGSDAGSDTEIRISSGKVFVQSLSLYCVVPKDIVRWANLWDSIWVRFDIIQDSPCIVDLVPVKPAPAANAVRKRIKEHAYEWVEKNNELKAAINAKERETMKVVELKSQIECMRHENKRLKTRLELHGIEGPHSQKWWMEWFGTNRYTQEQLDDLEDGFTGRFGEEWHLNPYYIAMAADSLFIADRPELDQHLAELLHDYKIDRSMSIFETDDIYGPTSPKIVSEYKGILKLVQDGRTLAQALDKVRPHAIYAATREATLERLTQQQAAHGKLPLTYTSHDMA